MIYCPKTMSPCRSTGCSVQWNCNTQTQSLSPESEIYTDWKQKYLEAQSELTALRGTIEYWKLRLSECENFNQKMGKEGETK